MAYADLVAAFGSADERTSQGHRKQTIVCRLSTFFQDRRWVRPEMLKALLLLKQAGHDVVITTSTYNDPITNVLKSEVISQNMDTLPQFLATMDITPAERAELLRTFEIVSDADVSAKYKTGENVDIVLGERSERELRDAKLFLLPGSDAANCFLRVATSAPKGDLDPASVSVLPGADLKSSLQKHLPKDERKASSGGKFLNGFSWAF
jgi:hypothetical protein